MKKAAKLFLIMLLALSTVAALLACESKEGEETVLETTMTLELFSAEDDDAPIAKDALGDVEEYYIITGYTFSSDDAAIVDKAKAYPGYYGENGNGSESEKAVYNNLKAVQLPTAVKVNAATSKLVLKLEGGKISSGNEYAIDANGLVAVDAEGDEVPVLGFADSAFSGHTELVTLNVPENYLTIGAGAFSGCSALEEVNLPFAGGSENALNAEKAFGYIFGTVEYTGAVSVTQNYNASGSTAFYIPGGLKKVTVGAFSKYAFYGVTTVETVTIPEVEAIPEYAFYGCTGINKFELPATVTEIKEGAFSGCSALYSIDVSKVETFGNSAFEGCAQLGYTEKTVNLAAAQYIGEKAFKGCSSIESITLAGVEVKAAAFSGCSALEEAALENCTLSVGVFASWGEFLNVTVTGNNTLVDGTALTAGDVEALKLVFIGAFVADEGTQKANVAFN